MQNIFFNLFNDRNFKNEYIIKIIPFDFKIIRYYIKNKYNSIFQDYSNFKTISIIFFKKLFIFQYKHKKY